MKTSDLMRHTTLALILTVAGLTPSALASGTVVAWGDKSDGQTSVPAGLTNVVAIAGGDNHSLALLADGMVVAWGDNLHGQTNVPADLTPPLGGAVAIAAGADHNLALRAGGTVLAWGCSEFI